jgi:hypothetical protein
MKGVILLNLVWHYQKDSSKFEVNWTLNAQITLLFVYYDQHDHEKNIIFYEKNLFNYSYYHIIEWLEIRIFSVIRSFFKMISSFEKTLFWIFKRSKCTIWKDAFWIAKKKKSFNKHSSNFLFKFKIF